MRLSPDDVRLFYRLYLELLLYVNSSQGILSDVAAPDELMSQPPEARVEVRNRLYDDVALIDTFLLDNPPSFSTEELEIVGSWKHFIRDRFFLFRHLKKYSVFLGSDSPPRAYGVLSISDRLKDLFPSVPVMVETVLLPFKGQIIYDGYIGAYPITFGGGVRGEFTNSYDEAKATYGIVTTLPFETSEINQSDEYKLKYYLKNDRNREYYWEEIQDLITEKPDLMIVYHQEMGKSHARTYGRQLREIGLPDSWFGILEGLIVASGKSKAELEKNLKAIVPEQKTKYIYYYHLKAKMKK